MSDCYVYLISKVPRETLDLVKVGISRSIAGRLATLRTASPFELEVAQRWRLPNRAMALQVEGTFHRRNAAKRTRGEWFVTDEEDAAIELCEICCETWMDEHGLSGIYEFCSFVGMDPRGLDIYLADMGLLECQ